MIIVRVSFPVDPEKADKVFDAAKAQGYTPDRAFTYPTTVDGQVVPTQTFTFHIQHGQIAELERLVNAFASFDVHVEIDGRLTKEMQPKVAAPEGVMPIEEPVVEPQLPGETAAPPEALNHVVTAAEPSKE